MLEHGGNLHDAARHFGRPVADWLDLSTGINPRFYPVPALAANAWHRLPEQSPDLCIAAQQFYGAPAMLAVAGSQAAIQALPRLRLQQHGVARVVVSAPSYAEHAYQWRQFGDQKHRAHQGHQGHHVQECDYALLDAAVADAATDVVVLCNPNNPTGERVATPTLLRWAAQLAARGGWLIVDEAFADTFLIHHANDTIPVDPDAHIGVAPWSAQPGLIVLRSVGKFFGLAGLRLGFVGAQPDLLTRLETMLGPWAVSGPAQQVALNALNDSTWQADSRHYLQQQGQRLQQTLGAQGWACCGTDLFQWCSDSALQGQTEQLWQHLAQQGIWVRLFRHAARGLRFGLPPDDAGWEKLNKAFATWTPSI
ncbi:threonine-phosphate decarboxylase CobD [soil metagenome]